MKRRAVFLDRDGTLIESVHYLTRPDQVRVIPGASECLRMLGAAGFLRIVVTNQAAMAKGLLSEDALEDVHEEVSRQLRADGASIDAWYHCPLARQGEDRELIEHPDRKPGPGMLLRAASEHAISLSDSWMVGDMVSDTLAGRHAGCKATVLVRTGLSNEAACRHSSVDHVVRSIRDVGPLIVDEGQKKQKEP